MKITGKKEDLRERLLEDWQFFNENRVRFCKEHNGKFLIIKDQEVKGIFDTEAEAYDTGSKKFGLGNFLIKHCIPEIETHTQSFLSRMGFEFIK